MPVFRVANVTAAPYRRRATAATMECSPLAVHDGHVLTEPTDFCRLFLFRHPEIETTQQGVAVGAGPANLTRRGRQQVLTWIEWLRGVEVAVVWSSPQPQCQEAARALAQATEADLAIDERLRDQEMGRWQGRAWSEIVQQEDAAVRTFFSEFGDCAAPGGENLGQAVERMLAWWYATLKDGLGKSLAVVGPGSVLAGFTAAMLGMRLSRCVSLNLPHGGLGVLDVFGNGARVATWNVGALPLPAAATAPAP